MTLLIDKNAFILSEHLKMFKCLKQLIFDAYVIFEDIPSYHKIDYVHA